MTARTIRTAAALRAADPWEQTIPLPAFCPPSPAAPARRPQTRQPARGTGRAPASRRTEGRVYHAPASARSAARRRKKHRYAAVLLRLAVLVLCGWALVTVLRGAAGALAVGAQQAGTLFLTAAGWETAAPEAPGTLAVEPVLQNPDLPNGCEAASLAALLRYAGVEADAVELAAAWIPREDFSYSGPDRFGPDPETAYVGDAASANGGWYCFAAPVAVGANNYLSFIGSDLRAEDLTGASFAELQEHLAAGRPVAVWFTQDYQDPRRNSGFTWTLPSGETYTPYGNLHCVVLAGVEGEECLLADPLAGSTRVDRDTFERIYTAMGSRALVVR